MDMIFGLNLFQNIKSNINKSLFFYRQHPTSLSKNKKILLARSKIFKSIAKKQKKINCLAVIAIGVQNMTIVQMYLKN